jgi:hypothetical protein
MAQIKVPATIDEVTPSYIRNVTAKIYGFSSDQISNRFCTILTSDYKRKSRNFWWLFGDKTRIEIKPTADQVIKSIKDNDSTSRKIIERTEEYLTSIGATYTSEQFTSNKCTHEKQEKRITNLLKSAKEDATYESAVVSGSIGQRYSIGINTTKMKKELGVINIDQSSDEWITFGGITTTMKNLRNYSKSDIVYAYDAGVLWNLKQVGLIFIPKEYISVTLVERIKDIPFGSIIERMSASSIILSMDYGDFCTCSQGAISSCYRVGGGHNMGAQMNFRSDFALIAYLRTSNKDSFDKAGRCWVYVKMTEDGKLLPRPFFTIQKSYGPINDAHKRMIEITIKDSIEKAFGIPASSSWKSTKEDIQASSMSVNTTSWGSRWSGGRAPYMDFGYMRSSYLTIKSQQALHSKNPEMFAKSAVPTGEAFPYNSANYPDGTTIILNFPDPMNLQGNVMQSGHLQEYGHGGTSAALGIIPEPVEVTCSVTGKPTITRDAFQMPNGDWISHEAAILAMQDKDVSEIIISEEEPEASVEEEEVVVDDADIYDF